MPKVSVFDMQGKVTGEMTLSEGIFAAEVNKAVLHQVVVAYLANQRQGTQSALTRAEVRGGGRKPWRQKGTGRARQGSIRSPQWTHGGVVFAPKPRSYRQSINKKVKRIAMKSAFSSCVIGNKLKIVDGATFPDIKTKSVVKFLGALEAPEKTLIITSDVDKNLVLSARNLPRVKTTIVSNISVYDLLRYDNIIILKDAISKIEEVYA